MRKIRRLQPLSYRAVLGGLVLALALNGLAGFSGVCRRVTGDTLRLHVRAADDTAAGQALKLQVRDAVLACAGARLAGAQSRRQAQQMLAGSLTELQFVAGRAARRGGQTARVYPVREHFAVTTYRDFALPGGDYAALRVDVGEARGHNWFCVLYPALCLSASAARYPSAEENSVVFGDYRLRLAALDWLTGLQKTVAKAGAAA